jgi:hypothetical protein
MTQLLTIEEAFLGMTEVKTALDLSNVKSLQRHLTNGQKKKFDHTLQLSKIVAKGYEWFKTEGKALLTEYGLEWKADDFAGKVYGWNRSYLFKVVKAGQVEEEKVETFKTKCDEMEREGKDPNRTLEGFLKWLKQDSVQGGQGEGEGGEGGEGEGGEAQPEARQKAWVTFTSKTNGANVSCRILENGELKTTGNTRDLISALSNLLYRVKNLQDNPMEDYEDRLEFAMDCEEEEDGLVARF